MFGDHKYLSKNVLDQMLKKKKKPCLFFFVIDHKVNKNTTPQLNCFKFS